MTSIIHLAVIFTFSLSVSAQNIKNMIKNPSFEVPEWLNPYECKSQYLNLVTNTYSNEDTDFGWYFHDIYDGHGP